jgi:membrane-associated phospholipid phosphatase
VIGTNPAQLGDRRKSAIAHVVRWFVLLALLTVASGVAVRGPIGRFVLSNVDGPTRRFVVNHDSVTLTRAFHDVSFLGRAAVAGSVAIVLGVAWALKAGAIRPLVRFGLAYGGATAITTVTKLAVRRRPAYGPLHGLLGGTYPSGHALIATAVYGTAAVLIVRSRLPLLIRRAAVALLIAVILAVAWGRVYLLAHYLSDVLAGLAFGVAWLVVVFRFDVGPGSISTGERLDR